MDKKLSTSNCRWFERVTWTWAHLERVREAVAAQVDALQRGEAVEDGAAQVGQAAERDIQGMQR